MFPHARNSLRRWSVNEQGSKTIPIPMGVSLHNVMSTIAAASSSAQERKRFRPNHESGLLPLLKLEVLVNEDVTNNDDDDGEPEEDTTSLSGTSSSSRVVYSSPTMMRSVQPAWEHLDERIDLPGEWWLRDPVYKTMRLRVTEIISDEEDRDESASSSTTFNNNNNKRSRFFLEIPLHPTKLERLHRDDAPDALPPNACLVYFSDGSTRCTYALFSVLLKHKLTEPSPIEDFSRFEDDVFRTLDGVPQTPDRRLRSESVSALLEPQDLNNRLIDEFDGPDEQMDSLNTDDIDFSESDESAIQKDIDNERERLLALIAREEFQFNTEVERLNEERETLSAMLREANEVKQHITQIKEETKKQSTEFRKDLFRKGAQQIKLLRELQMVYPITLDSKKGFLIRDLRLPVDIYTTTVPEEEISAALGFCCHLIFMASKYFSIALRYRLFCNSSRSAIQLDANTFLPLFTARSVEREHLDRAMDLLGANADCILMTLGIEFTPKSHILARLKRIYDYIIEGEIPLHDNGIH